MIPRGLVMELQYATGANVERKLKFNRRSLMVQRCRDLLREPLEIERFIQRPFLRRGRYVLEAVDLRLDEKRLFYLSNSKEFWSDSLLKVGVYDDSGKLIDVIGQPAGNTFFERLRMVTEIRSFQRRYSTINLGVFSDDLRLFTAAAS